MDHHVLGVVAASGGLGASTLALTLAVRAGPSVGASVCVDGSLRAGGLDVTACLEHLPGLRWGDLADLRGEADGAAVLRALPGQGALRVLASRGPAPPWAVARDCVRALASVSALVVVDLGTTTSLLDVCTDLVVVAGVTARRLADAAALAELPEVRRCDPALVLRGARREPVSPEEVAVHLDLPLLGVLRDDPRVRTDEDRARLPGSRAKGTVGALADLVLGRLDGHVGSGDEQLLEESA